MADRPDIVICGYSEAAMLLREPSRHSVKAVLSIHGRHEHGVEAGIQPRLDLHFDDVEVESADDPVQAFGVRQRLAKARRDGLAQVSPTEADAKAIIDFAGSTRELRGVVLFQCLGGVSRSSAAALICLAYWMGPGEEQRCIDDLLHIRPCAQPHLGLVRFADGLMGRSGRLVQILRSRSK